MGDSVSAFTPERQTQLTFNLGKMAYMSIGANVKRLRQEREWSQVELARRVGVSRVRITQIENDPSTQVKGDTLLGLAKAFGCLPDDLVHGWATPVKQPEPEDFANIPVLDVELSAGFGADASNEDVIDQIPIPYRLLEEFNVPPMSARVVIVKGDSMEKTLRDGEKVIVDVSDKRLISEGVYAFIFDGERKVKRFVKQFDSNWIIRSDNNQDPAYQDQIVSPHNIQQLSIIGRVAGVLARKI